MSATWKGLVTKAGFMDKTVTVTVNRMVQDKRTRKMLLRSKKFLTHDPENKLQKDDHVVIRQCAPVSKRKAHTLDRILRSPETEAAAVRATLLAATAADRVAKEAAQVKAEEVMLKETGASREVLDEALKTRMARELFDIESKKEQDRKLAFDEAKKDAMLRD